MSTQDMALPHTIVRLYGGALYCCLWSKERVGAERWSSAARAVTQAREGFFRSLEYLSQSIMLALTSVSNPILFREHPKPFDRLEHF